ncbi:MAG TPA: ZIP family metal transporter [Candidatus Paceibacterota bacterium]
MLYFIAIAAFFSTLLGGLFALRLKDRLHLILGFSAGAIIGVAFFDLLPEAIDLSSAAYSASTALAITALGFVLYLTIDRTILLHHHHDEDDHDAASDAHIRGTAGAGSLSIHSLLDGIGIGLAFQVSTAVGVIVAVAVLAHDFSDGINTVNMILKHGGEKARALRWLYTDAAAPVIGIISTRFFTVPETQLGLLLSLFAGFFLYISASDLIPESYHKHPRCWTTVSTILGIVTLYVIIHFAG